MNNLLNFIDAGISIIPTTSDKLPFFQLLPNNKWDEFQRRLPTPKEIAKWQQYKSISIAIVCGEVSGNLEVIDIDNHKGNADATYNDFKEIVESYSSTLWNSLIVEKSQSGGYHIIYRFDGKSEGSKKLALQYIDNKKDTFIETKGEGGYVIVSPSPGYSLMQGSFTHITTLSNDDRYFLLQVAKSFNEITEEVSYNPPSVITNTNNDNTNTTRPGDKLNDIGDHRELLLNAGWTLLSTTSKGTELWRRPGKNRGISATYNHIPNRFYVFSTNADPFENNRVYDKFAIYTMLNYNGDWKQAARHIKDDYPQYFNNIKINKMQPVANHNEKTIEHKPVKIASTSQKPNILPKIETTRMPTKQNSNITNEQHPFKDNSIATPPLQDDGTDVQFAPNTIFWKDIIDSHKNPKLVISKAKLINFLEYHKFGKIWLDTNVSQFIRLKDHIITEETPETIIDFIKGNILNLPDGNITDNFSKQDIWEACLNNISKLKAKDLLETLKIYDIHFIKDTKDTCFFFFKNCIVEVTENEIISKSYANITNYIWHDQIIQHNFTLLPEDEASNPYNSVFGKFLLKVCSPISKEDPLNRDARIVDEDRYQALASAIGYLLHTYQNPSLTKAVIFCEEKLSTDDDANGRTGKGLTSYAVSKLRKRVTYNGKSVDFNDKFFYQKISPDTQLVYFDDVKKNFDFESLFSVLTEGFSIEYKGMKPIEIKFDDVPKFLISTNSVLANDNDSYKARKFEIEFSDYFSADYTPIDEFGENLFEKGWADNDPEWDWFFNYMLNCARLYLKEGLVYYEPVNLVERKLKATINDEFLEYADGLLEKMENGEKIYREDLYNGFVNQYKAYALNSKFAVSSKSTTRWFNQYLKLKKIEYIEAREPSRNDRRRYWILTKYIQNNEVINNNKEEDNELPF